MKVRVLYSLLRRSREMRWFERMPGIENDEGHIRGFFDEYRWLSNFHPCNVMWKGLMFGSSEAAYQAAKSLDPEDWKQFTHLTASESKRKGQRIKMREDWDSVKVSFMYDILQDKFLRNKDLADKLKATGDKHLEETNWWNDTYWGVCKGEGENMLGELLMDVRTQINSPQYEELRKLI